MRRLLTILVYGFIFQFLYINSGLTQNIFSEHVSSNISEKTDVSSDPDENEPSPRIVAVSSSQGGGSQAPFFSSSNIQVDPYTGSASTGLQIEVSQGRGGIQPQLALSYNSGLGNSILGMGWSLDVGAIARSTKNGIPKYDQTDDFVFIQNGSPQELVYDVMTERYYPEIEGSFMHITKEDEYWRVVDRNGVQYYFGESTGSREFDSNDSSRTFKWCLNRVRDAHGNEMYFEYIKDGNKLYLSNIDYTSNVNQGLVAFANVNFEYEDREDKRDAFVSGFRIETNKRLKNIQIFVKDVLQRKYEMDYKQSALTKRSLLLSVTQYGKNGEALPATLFSYQNEDVEKLDGYENTLVSNNLNVTGDNLWQIRYYKQDFFRDNSFILYPIESADKLDNGCFFQIGICFPWGEFRTLANYDWPDGNWRQNGLGSVEISTGPDMQIHAKSYVFSEIQKTLDFNAYGGYFFLNGNYGAYDRNGRNLTFKSGYTLIDFTEYHQHSNMRFDLRYDLAKNVNLMNSKPIFNVQTSGDFNGDGFNDLAELSEHAGTVKVSLFNGIDFDAPTTWISNFGKDKKLLSADINGDGMMDVAEFDEESRNWRFAYSDGSKLNIESTWNDGIEKDQKVGFADFNGDGQIDIYTYKQDSSSSKFNIALNNNGLFEFLPNVLNFNFDYTNTPLVADFNGDGLADIATFKKSNGYWQIFRNESNLTGAFIRKFELSNFGKDKNIVIADFNQDGLIDIGFYNDVTGRIEYRTFLDSDFNLAEIEIFDIEFNMKKSYMNFNSADFNGDGVLDFVGYSGVGHLEYALSTAERSDLLLVINNGVGALTHIEYENSNQYDNTYLPFSIPLVKSSEIRDQFSGDSYKTDYFYQDGLWDASTREFRGFGYVMATDVEGTVSKSIFHQDEFKKGRVARSLVMGSDGHVYSESLNTYSDPIEVVSGVHAIYQTRSDTITQERGESGKKRTAQTLNYDEFGNATQVIQLGEVDVATGADIGEDSRLVMSEYTKNTNSDVWILGAVKSADIKNHTGELMRRSWFYYDGQQLDEPPTKGLLTKKVDWAGEGKTNIEVQYKYDVLGNLIETTDPLNNKTIIEYDQEFQMFPLVTQNAIGHRVVNQYYGVDSVLEESAGAFKGLWGQLKSTTDPNEQMGMRVYDGFGRPVKSISPNDTFLMPTSTTQIKHFSDYTKITTESRIESGRGQMIKGVSFYDGLGRMIQSKQQIDEGKFIVGGQQQYNARGLGEKQYLPIFSTSGFDTIDPIDTNRPHGLIEYDELGRVIKSVNPDGTYSNVIYKNWKTESINANGHKQASIYDAYGRLIKKIEYTGADGRSSHYLQEAYQVYAQTSYVYDSEGNLTNTIDAHGNTVSIGYDKLGRKILMDDPDMGVWGYAYGLNGNLISQTDAKGQTINFEYDPINRLTRKYDNVDLNVAYTYDDVSLGYSKGRLNWASYKGGATNFQYDNLGREVASEKTIGVHNNRVERSYNALSQLLNVNYPNQESVNYSYDSSGRLKSIGEKGTVFEENVTPELFSFNDFQSTSKEGVLDVSENSVNFSKVGRGEMDGYVVSENNLPENFSHSFEFEMTGSNRWGKEIGIWGVSDKIDQNYKDWDSGLFLTVRRYRREGIRLILGAVNRGRAKRQDYSRNLVVGKKYYFSVKRAGEVLQVDVYDDSNRTNLVDSLSAHVDGAIETNYLYSYFAERVRTRINQTIAGSVSRLGTNQTVFERSQDVVKNIEYNAEGQIIRTEFINGVVTTYDYDPLTLRPSRVLTVSSNGEILQDFVYHYDSVGNIIEIEDKVHTATQVFKYDSMNRLVNAVGDSYGVRSYSFDEIGNILEKDGRVYTYGEDGAGPHAVTSLSDGTTFKYGSNGNMIEKLDGTGVKTIFVYDVENRLLSVTRANQILASFVYDGDGGRVSKTDYRSNVSAIAKSGLAFDALYQNYDNLEYNAAQSSGKITTYVGSLYETTDGVATRHIYLGSQHVASVTNGEIRFFHGDHLGGRNVTTDETGKLIELVEYTPFGSFSKQERYDSSEATAWHYFTGQKFDDETGLYFYNARYYDPDLGRFITADTLVPNFNNPQNLNRYTYANNNPVNNIDPSGHGWFSKLWKSFKKNVLGHLINAIRLTFAILTFPVNPVGSTLEIASVVAAYTGRGDSQKTSRILGWASLGWNVGQGVHNAFDEGEVQLLGADGEIISDYSQVENVLGTGINTTQRGALRALHNANKNLSIKYDAVIWNKTHGAVSDFVESGIVKFTGSKTLSNEYAKIINNVRFANPTALFDVHSEGTILFTRAFQDLPANSLNNATVNFYGTAVLETTARNSFLIPGGSTGVLTFNSRFSDPITSFFGSLNPVRMVVGGGAGIATLGKSHNIYGYLAERYPK